MKNRARFLACSSSLTDTVFSYGTASSLYIRRVPFSQIFRVPVLQLLVFIKGGHMQFKPSTPQYCGQPNRLRSCGLKKVAELWLRTFKIWLPQFATFRSLLPVRYFLVPFPQLRMVLKVNKKIFLESSVSLETENLP